MPNGWKKGWRFGPCALRSFSSTLRGGVTVWARHRCRSCFSGCGTPALPSPLPRCEHNDGSTSAFALAPCPPARAQTTVVLRSSSGRLLRPSRASPWARLVQFRLRALAAATTATAKAVRVGVQTGRTERARVPKLRLQCVQKRAAQAQLHDTIAASGLAFCAMCATMDRRESRQQPRWIVDRERRMRSSEAEMRAVEARQR